MRRETVFGTHFCGNEISDYGKKNGRVDYRTLAKSFDGVLCNGIINKTSEIGYWELENGNEYYYEDENGNYLTEEEYEELTSEEQEKCYEKYDEVFQYYIIDSNGADILKDYTNELVWYNEELDMYVWGVTHYGTAWDYVLTEIPCKADKE